MMTIKEIIYKAEKKFKKIELRKDVWGFQIQPNTKFIKGSSRKEIDELQLLFGFDFPWDYKEMLLTFSTLDTPEISIDPDNNEIEYSQDNFFYQYPDDYEKSRWIINEIEENKFEAESVLSEADFNISKIVGYIPVHHHRVLVVFEDKYLSPVISVWGSDIIMFGKNLREYLKNELLRI